MHKLSLLLAVGLTASFLSACSHPPDSYQAINQIKRLPENKGARVAQWPSDNQEFVVIRTDGSVWRYRSWDLGYPAIRSTDPEYQSIAGKIGKHYEGANLLANEDRVLGSTLPAQISTP